MTGREGIFEKNAKNVARFERRSSVAPVDSLFVLCIKARDIRSSKTFLSWAGSFLTGGIGTVTKYFRKIITANSELEGSPRMKVFVR